ncbi:MAG: signal peptide peptidase SppA [Phycisphaerae bacterium]|nr:signal peptide peptidase SppA [Phycisphaerae bacterium]
MKRWVRHLMYAGLVLPLSAAPVRADETEKIVHFRITGPVLESPPTLALGGLFGEDEPLNLFDLLKTLNRARTDESVRALIFDVDEAALGLSQIQELRQQFKRLRAADKDVWIYSEAPGLGTYLLASSATKLVMMPRGELGLVGLYSTPMYFKGLLDKIGVEFDVVHCGAYKAAGEPFTRTGPSKEADEDMKKLMDGIYESIIAGIAESRKLSVDEVRKLIDNGPYSAKEAKEAGLVDDLAYREDFLRSIKKRYGSEAKIVHTYGKKSGPEIDFANPFAIFKIFGEMMKGTKPSDENAIAVIYVESIIMTGRSQDDFFGKSAGSDTIRKAIDDAAKDDRVKAVVLRVDSPGGSAIASEVIAEAAKRLKGEKPFVVSMGDVAASGGYYVSCLADCIFAQPGTITGSIGVIGMKPVTTEMWGKLGISRHEYKRGDSADLMSSVRPWNEDHRARINKMMNRVYKEFKGRVTEGRGRKIKGDLEDLAGGRVYTGGQALDVGLVDKLGGLDDAIRYAADQAEISKYELRILPKPKTFADLLAKSMGLEPEDEEDVSIRTSARSPFLLSPAVQAALPALEASDPQAAAALKAALRQMEMFRKEAVALIGPPIPRPR